MKYTLAELASRSGATLHGDGDYNITGVASLESAQQGQISFLTSSQYRKYLATTKASAVILRAEDLSACATNALVSDNPYLAYARIGACFAPPPAAVAGIHPRASVDAAARVAASAQVDAGAVVGPETVIGEGTIIGPNCVLGERVRVGSSCRLVANVVLCDGISIGNNCQLHPGAVVGSDGFGLANDAGVWVKVPQVGSVIIEDDVEIGANTTIDRGAIHDTVIRRGAKLDNQIQIAHNVEIGEHSAIAACTGIAGSTRIGAHCTLAGGVGVVGHIETADHVHLSGMTMLSRSVREPGVYSSGIRAMPHKQWQKNMARIKQLDTMAKRISALEKQLAQHSQKITGNEQEPTQE